MELLNVLGTLFFIAVFVGAAVLPFFLTNKRVKQEKALIDEKIQRLADGTAEMTPEDFLEMRNRKFGGPQKYALQHNFAGVYILFNKSKNMYYVGQATKILDRVNNHFTGKGNGDVYADYKYGDTFTIKMIALENSGFDSLNALEKATIGKYDAFSKGYNKTRGNR